MARVRRRVSLEDHVPEAVTYVAKVVGRELPQPDPLAGSEESTESDDDGDEDGPPDPESREFAAVHQSSSMASARLRPSSVISSGRSSPYQTCSGPLSGKTRRCEISWTRCSLGFQSARWCCGIPLPIGKRAPLVATVQAFGPPRW